MSRLTDAIDALKTSIEAKLAEAIELIRNPNNADTVAGIAMLEALREQVAGTDLTPDEAPE